MGKTVQFRVANPKRRPSWLSQKWRLSGPRSARSRWLQSPLPKLRYAPRSPNLSPCPRSKPRRWPRRRCRKNRCDGRRRFVRRCRRAPRRFIRLCAPVRCLRGLCPRLVPAKSCRDRGSRCRRLRPLRPCRPPRSRCRLSQWLVLPRRLLPRPGDHPFLGRYRPLRLLERRCVRSRARRSPDNLPRVPWCLRGPIWWHACNSSNGPCLGKRRPPPGRASPAGARRPCPASRSIVGLSGPASR